MPERPAAHFIPFRKADIIEMCAANGTPSADDARQFRRFSQVLVSVYHFEYHRTLNLVTGEEGGLGVASLHEACRLLDERWDAYFDFPARSA